MFNVDPHPGTFSEQTRLGQQNDRFKRRLGVRAKKGPRKLENRLSQCWRVRRNNLRDFFGR
jgi:hypothetical protein